MKNIEFLLDIVRALSYNNKVANIYAAMAQMVERVLGKDEVTGSNPVISSSAIRSLGSPGDRIFFFPFAQKRRGTACEKAVPLLVF